MTFSSRDVQISARVLVARHGVGALRRAEDHVRRMERLHAHEAAATWRGLALAIRELLSDKRAGRIPVRRRKVQRTGP